MSVKTALESLYADHGELTPGLVLDEARDPGHELHQHFEWDDSEAAERYRLHQAKGLIRSVKIRYTHGNGAKDGPKVRRYHAVFGAESTVYKSADDILADPLLRKIKLKDMERDWGAMEQRYRDFTEFWELVSQSVSEKQTA